MGNKMITYGVKHIVYLLDIPITKVRGKPNTVLSMFILRRRDVML